MRAVPAALLLAVASLVAGAGGAACSGECGDVSCGSGVVVWWLPGEIPDSPGHRLCVDGRCAPVRPSAAGASGQYLAVSPPDARDDREVRVRLELLDPRGEATAAFTGGGEKTGRCCPGVELRVQRDGNLVVDPM